MALSGPDRAQWLVSYDISATRARSAVAVDLAARGVRLAYSLFVIGAPATELVALMHRASEVIEGDDHVFAVRWCAACEGAIHGDPLGALHPVAVAEEDLDDV